MGNEPNEYLGEQLKRVEWEPDITPTLLEINIIKGIWKTKRYRVATHILREYIKLRINAAVADYRAELRPEPTAGDRDAAEKLAWELARDLQAPACANYMRTRAYEVNFVRPAIDKIAAALAAARAPLEAKVKALEAAVGKIWGMARTLAATSNMTGKYAQKRAIEIRDALAALVKAEEVESDE